MRYQMTIQDQGVWSSPLSRFTERSPSLVYVDRMSVDEMCQSFNDQSINQLSSSLKGGLIIG